MVYKSKKINKRRYFKRQSRKRQYGGDPLNQQEIIDEKILGEIEPPTVVDNFKKGLDIGLQLGNNIVATGLQYVEGGVEDLAQSVGIDTNASVDKEIGKIADKTNKLAAVLKTEKGQEVLSNLGDIAVDVVNTVGGPAIKEFGEIGNNFVKEEIPIIANMGKTALLEVPVLGQAVAAGQEVLGATSAIAKAVDSAAELTEAGADAAKDLQKESGKIQDGLSQIKDLVEGVNTGVSSGLDVVKKTVDSYGKETVKANIKKSLDPNSYISKSLDPKLSNTYQTVMSARGGGLLKKYQKERMMIGGRTLQSQLEFLDSNVNRSQILQQYGGKWKTKSRRSLKRKMTSRSYK